ncbi:MAG TPA: hypothetical protein VFG21_11485 [Xanthomonadaceae bacterium]|nr:hypothetical protein [Xanthomonadaceae bacterium]
MKLFTTIPLFLSSDDDSARTAPSDTEFRPRYGNRAASRRFLGLPLHADAEFAAGTAQYPDACLAGCG